MGKSSKTDLSSLKKIILLIKTINNWPLVLLDKTGLVKQIKYSTRLGPTFICRSKSTDINELAVIFSGHEYPKKYLSLDKNSVVVDLGANIGCFSVYLWKVNKNKNFRCYAVEPHPKNIQYLHSNLSLNKLEKKVNVIAAAISDKNGHAYLNTSPGFDAAFVTEEPSPCRVKSYTLESFCKLTKIDNIDLLKIDIEGSEYNVVNKSVGFINKHVKKIILEYHEISSDSSKNSDYLVKQLTDKFNVEYISQHKNSGVLVFERIPR